MYKKGFTLVELMASLIILSIVLLVAIPAVIKAIKNSTESAYDMSITSIKVAMQNWKNDHTDILPNVGDYMYLTISELKHEGYLNQEMINPETEKPFPNDMLLKLENTAKGFNYIVDATTGTATNSYHFITPYIDFPTQIKTYINVGGTYTNIEATAYNSEGLVIATDITKEPIGESVDTTKPGTYYVEYKATIEDIPVSIVETIEVLPITSICSKVTGSNLDIPSIGDTYTCNLGTGDLTFYILGIGINDITFIMNKNIGNNTSFSNLANNTSADAANAYLKMVTKDWNIAARLPLAIEIANASGQSSITNETINSKLYENTRCNVNECTIPYNSLDTGYTNGYWTSTKAGELDAYAVDGSGKIITYQTISTNYGVRPVISVSNSKIAN